MIAIVNIIMNSASRLSNVMKQSSQLNYELISIASIYYTDTMFINVMRMPWAIMWNMHISHIRKESINYVAKFHENIMYRLIASKHLTKLISNSFLRNTSSQLVKNFSVMHSYSCIRINSETKLNSKSHSSKYSKRIFHKAVLSKSNSLNNLIIDVKLTIKRISKCLSDRIKCDCIYSKITTSKIFSNRSSKCYCFWMTAIFIFTIDTKCSNFK